MRSIRFIAALTLISSVGVAADFPREKFDESGFETVFDGKSLNGWHVSTQTGHSHASMHTSGGRWKLEDGAIVGSQDIPGNGGIILTDRQFGNFEVVLEMKNDFGPDSGLFLRSNERGQAYQYMIDYHDNGNLAGIYGEGLSGGIHHRNFDFLDAVSKIRPKDAIFACPIQPDDWPEFWKPGEWNELRARVEGNPPKITTWINRVRFMEFKDTEKRHPDAGSIALQVHGGGDFTSQFVRYRNVRVKELKTQLAYLDPREAGYDYQIQGEYIGKIGDKSYGVQVIARGDGKFEGVFMPGGLPGAGWDPSSEPTRVQFETKDCLTKSVGGDFEATISFGTLTVKKGERSSELKLLHRESPTLAKPAPEGAVVLFNGTNVDQWEPGKMAETGLMSVGTRTKNVFENFTLHLEFRTPFMPKSSGQQRGNSGLYLGDQYECQILDSFGLSGADNECGGIYKNAKPLVNMCLPPLSWQTYDVDFTCAKFDADGKQTAPARVTIKHNGVVIHDNLELKSTPGGGRSDEKPGAIYLQDHNDPVRFRNIWLVEKK